MKVRKHAVVLSSEMQFPDTSCTKCLQLMWRHKDVWCTGVFASIASPSLADLRLKIIFSS